MREADMYEVEIKRNGLSVYNQRFATMNVQRFVTELNSAWWTEVEERAGGRESDDGTSKES
jgi:hypothetical protein